MSKPAVAYGAKSTEDKHRSIPTQIEDCRQLAEREGWDVQAEYQDEAFSAFHGNRGPGLARAKARAIELAKEHGECVLVAQDVDRFARGAGDKPGAADHFGEMFFALRRQGVSLWSVRMGEIDSIRAVVEGDRAYSESQRKSEAVQKGVRRRVVDRRQYAGGRRPYGYRWVAVLDSDGDPVISAGGRLARRLEVDEAEAAIVRRIFSEYVSGEPQNAIAERLNGDPETDPDVPTLTGAKSKWYATTVAGMIRNPLYVGYVTLHGEHYEATHEPIIDPSTWEQACALRASRHSQGRPRGRRTTGRHLLTEGLLVCTCGSAMSPRTARDHRYGTIYETYVCVERLHHGPRACPQPPIKRAMIDESVNRYFEAVALDEDGTRKAFTAYATQELDDAGTLQRQAESELARVEAALERIEGDYVAGKISAEKWDRLERRLQDELAASRAQADQHERRRSQVQEAIDAIDVQAEIAQRLTERRRAIAGQIEDGRGDLGSFRATLKRLFVGFELGSPSVLYGSGVLRGQRWAQRDDYSEDLLQAGEYRLFPVVASASVDLRASDGVGFPAVQRAALAPHDFLCTRFSA